MKLKYIKLKALKNLIKQMKMMMIKIYVRIANYIDYLYFFPECYCYLIKINIKWVLYAVQQIIKTIKLQIFFKENFQMKKFTILLDQIWQSRKLLTFMKIIKLMKMFQDLVL